MTMSTNHIFEQYIYQGWVITIENYFGTDDLVGFASPAKWAHLVNADNYRILEDENIYGILAEPDDARHYGVNTKDASSVLNYMISLIIQEEEINWKNPIVLKQVCKKSTTKKIGEKSRKSRGACHQAWALLVKERDKKCVNCKGLFDLHAHHVKLYKTHPELRYDVNNGITLCSTCHREFHKTKIVFDNVNSA